MGKSVTSAEFQKAFGRYREAALKEPVTITSHDRDSLVLIAADEYRRLKSLDRQALYVSELGEGDLQAILAAEPPAEAAQFDDELKALPRPQPGLVIRYAYVWRDQCRAGQEEGVKDRPCVIILAVETADGATMVAVAPVTHLRPERAEDGIEIPLPTKRRLDLDDAPSWIVGAEVNRFAWPGPDLRPVARGETSVAFGFAPAALSQALKAQIVRNGRIAVTKRD